MGRALACFLLMTAWPHAAGADGMARDEMDALRAAVAEGRALSLAAIMPDIAAALPGKILDVQFQDAPGGPVYLVTVLSPDWRLWTLVVEAASGVVRNPPARAIPKKKGQT